MNVSDKLSINCRPVRNGNFNF